MKKSRRKLPQSYFSPDSFRIVKFMHVQRKFFFQDAATIFLARKLLSAISCTSRFHESRIVVMKISQDFFYKAFEYLSFRF